MMKCIYCSDKMTSLQKLFCDRCDKNIPDKHRTKLIRNYLSTKKKLKDYMKDKYSNSKQSEGDK